jgi:CBS domain-containing protein
VDRDLLESLLSVRGGKVMDSLESILKEKGRAVCRVGPDLNVIDAVGTMCASHVGALVVMKDDIIIGMFSERDLMRRVVLSRLDPAQARVADVMTRRVVCTGPEVSPKEAMAVMTRECVRHLPVLRGGRVDGVISMGDLVRWTIHEQEHVVDQLTDYVTGKYPG